MQPIPQVNQRSPNQTVAESLQAETQGFFLTTFKKTARDTICVKTDKSCEALSFQPSDLVMLH